jgi:hypothetical protein
MVDVMDKSHMGLFRGVSFVGRMGSHRFSQGIPSGKHTENYGKSPILIGNKSTNSMAIFNSKLFVYQRV